MTAKSRRGPNVSIQERVTEHTPPKTHVYPGICNVSGEERKWTKRRMREKREEEKGE